MILVSLEVFEIHCTPIIAHLYLSLLLVTYTSTLVVLISLVVDSDSRTPFVRLVNRMIVLLSRARLGMYIVGNVGYFENNKQGLSPHWSRLLEGLRGSSRSSDYQTIFKSIRK